MNLKLKFAILLLLLSCLIGQGQSDVQFALTDPQFGISQTTNATVTVQLWSFGSDGQLTLLPLQLRQITDTTGQTTFTNLWGATNAGVYNFTIAPYQSSKRISGNFWVSSTNMGLVPEGLIDVVQNPAPFPYQFPWSYSALASDRRYGISTNLISGYVTSSQLIAATNTLFLQIPSTNGFVTGGITNGLATTNYVNLALLFATNGWTPIIYTNPAYYASLAALVASNAAIYTAIAAATNGLNGSLTTASNLLATTKQPASLTLTNLSATGAFTNILAAGQNMAFTTNGSGNTVTLNATNQVFLTNGITGTAYVPLSSLQASSLVLSNLTGTGAFTNTIAPGTNMVFTTNGSGVVTFSSTGIPSSATNNFVGTNQVLSILATNATVANGVTNVVGTNKLVFVISNQVLYGPTNLDTNGAATYQGGLNTNNVNVVSQNLTNTINSYSNLLWLATSNLFASATNLSTVQSNGLYAYTSGAYQAATNTSATAAVAAGTVATNQVAAAVLSITNSSQYRSAITNTQNGAIIGGMAHNNFQVDDASGVAVLDVSNEVLNTDLSGSPYTAFLWSAPNGPEILYANTVVLNGQTHSLYSAHVSSPLPWTEDGALILTNGTSLYDTNGAGYYWSTNALNVSTNFAATNTTAQILNATNRAYNFVASTNGQATSLMVYNFFGFNGKTNTIATTNVIQIPSGTYAGAYVQSPFGGVTWTNTQNTNLTFILGSGVYFLQTNSTALTFWNTATNGFPGTGNPISAGGPTPFASYGSYDEMNGRVVHGIIVSTNLTAQIAGAVAQFLLAGYGLSNSLNGNTNTVFLNTNTVVALIEAYANAPTNGYTGAEVTNAILNYGGSLFVPLTNPNITNAFYTNLISLAPVISGGTVFIETNGATEAGNGPTNGIAATNGVGFNTLLLNPTLSNSTFIANLIVSNIQAVPSGNPQNLIGIGDYPNAIGGAEPQNVAIGSGPNLFFGSGANVGSVVLSGENDTNIGASSVEIGPSISNSWGNCVIINESGQLINPTAYNQIMIYEGAGGIVIGTNAAGGFGLNMFGTANFSGLYIKGSAVIAGGNQTPWVQTINGAGYSLTNVSTIYGTGSGASGILLGTGGGYIEFEQIGNGNPFFSSAPSGLAQFSDTSGDNILTVEKDSATAGGPYVELATGMNAFEFQNAPVSFDNHQIESDGSGDLSAINFWANGSFGSTNANSPTAITYLGATQLVLGVQGQGAVFSTTVTAPMIATPSVNASSINASYYLYNNSPLYFDVLTNGLVITNSTLFFTNSAFDGGQNFAGVTYPATLWTNYYGIFAYDAPSNYFTNCISKWIEVPQGWKTNLVMWTNCTQYGWLLCTNTVGFVGYLNGNTSSYTNVPWFINQSGSPYGTYAYSISPAASNPGYTVGYGLPNMIPILSTLFNIAPSSITNAPGFWAAVPQSGGGSPNGTVFLVAGTNQVSDTAFQSNSPPALTYNSLDGTISPVAIRESQSLQGSYFTIVSGNPNDTNSVSYK